MSTATRSYMGHRYPVEIINGCVWLYFRFPLSFRGVEELMLVGGVAVSYETIRRWCAKFGQAYANQLRRRRPRPGDKWHLGVRRDQRQLRYLWRVDQHGNVLDVLVQATPKRGGGPAILPSAAHGPAVGAGRAGHRQAGQLPGRSPRAHVVGAAPAVAVSEPRRELCSAHPTTRTGDERFTSSRHAHRLLSAVSGISAHLRPRRHLLSATEGRTERADRFAVWRQVTALDAAA